MSERDHASQSIPGTALQCMESHCSAAASGAAACMHGGLAQVRDRDRETMLCSVNFRLRVL